MNTDEIKLEIKDQISKTNENFITKLGTEIYTGISGEDIDLLEKLLLKINRHFKIFKLIAILFSALLIMISMLKFFDSLDWGNMNKAGLFITFTIVFILNAANYSKIKVNLENKIWLLKLLDRIEKV